VEGQDEVYPEPVEGSHSVASCRDVATTVAWRRDRYGSLYADKGDNYNTLKAFLARESFSARGEPVDHRNVEFRTDALWSRLQIRGFVTNGSVREGFVLGPQGQLDAIRDHVHGTGMIDASIDVIGARLIGGLIGGATGWLGKQWVTMFGREVTEVVAAKGVLRSFDDVVANPKALWGKSADEVGSMLGEGWTKGAYGSSKTGWKFTRSTDGQSIFYHPGGGRHGGSYYGFSSGTLGKTKIVGADYIPLKGDKATIINIGN